MKIMKKEEELSRKETVGAKWNGWFCGYLELFPSIKTPG